MYKIDDIVWYYRFFLKPPTWHKITIRGQIDMFGIRRLSGYCIITNELIIHSSDRYCFDSTKSTDYLMSKILTNLNK